MSYAIYFINRLSVSVYSSAVLYYFWCNTPTLGSPLDYLCTFGCAAFVSLLGMPRDRKLVPSKIADMHVGHDLGPSLEEGICIQPGRVG